MPLKIVKDNIVNMKVDAIVNAANTELLMGGGVCGAIFNAAGINELQAACQKISPIKTGEAVLTPGFKLYSKNIIHTAGPVYEHSNKEKSKILLIASYYNSLKLAVSHNFKTVAFPLISSGIYGYPVTEALNIAVLTINDCLKTDNNLNVFLTIFDDKIFKIAKDLFPNLIIESKNYGTLSPNI